MVAAGAAILVIFGLAIFIAYRQSGPRLNQNSTRSKIVVLPFDNLGLPDDEYFAAGITEEITSRLATVRELGVISRTSGVQYNATGKTIAQIGEDLGVDFVLEGTVRWAKGEPGFLLVHRDGGFAQPPYAVDDVAGEARRWREAGHGFRVVMSDSDLPG